MAPDRKKDRTARLQRTANVLYQYPEGLSAKRLAELCGVCVRTTYRDLMAMHEIDYKVWQNEGKWGLERGVFLPPLKLTLLEAMTLFLAARLASRYSDERDHDIESAFGKLAAVMPRPVGRHVTETIASMHARPEDARYSRVFDILATAWATGRRVCIWYPWTGNGATRVYERLVDPYFLEPSAIGHSCYLIAYCHHVNAIRLFKLERIREIELTDQPYQVPEDFDANAFLKSSWGVFSDEEVEVKLRFSPIVAPRVKESTWHPSQQLCQLENGYADFTVKVAGTVEITPWILGWGAEVEVLAPPELRERIAATAQRMGALYSTATAEGTILQGQNVPV